MPTIRIVSPADLPAIAARNATADTTPFTVEARLDWFNAHTADEYPIYVCDADDGHVLG
jgi:L-amino acid N-acyltransferase YncA